MLRRLAVPLALLLVLAIAAPASAITNPTQDNGAHPQVGQLLFYVPTEYDPRFVDPGSWFNCSGTLLSPTVLLTAGHCTYDVGYMGAAPADPFGGGNDIWVTFDETASYDWVFGIGSSTFAPYNNAGRYAAWSAALDADPDWVRGTAYTHPSFNPNAFLLHDAGIVVLDEPVTVDSYGTLPAANYLDQFLRQPKNEQRFTPVGYGLNRGFPLYVGGDTRMQASVMLVNLQGAFGLGQRFPGTAVIFSNNGGRAHKGGTCFGDSGGPIFEGSSMKIVAVTSFGISQTCTGTGGGYRIDQADDLTWIGSFLATP